MFVNMIAVPDELRKKLLACRRIISRLSDWRWDIEHAEALRVEMDSLNAELFDLVPEDEEIPYEFGEKVEHYNVMLDRYIDRLKSGSVSSILNYNVTSLDGLAKSMICSEHINVNMNVSKDSNEAVHGDLVNNLVDPNRTIFDEHVMNLVDSHESMSNVNAVGGFVVSSANGGHENNLDAMKNEPEPESSSLFGLRFPSRENCSIEIREKTNELQCSILEFKNESNLLSKFEFFDEVNIMKEAKEIVNGADLAFAKNCLSNYPDFREFIFMFTIMNTNDDDFVYDFLELDDMKTRSDRLVIIGKIFDPYGFDPGKLKCRLLYRLAIYLDLVVQFPIVIVEQVKNHLIFVNELSDLKIYRYIPAGGEIYGIMYVFVSAFGYVIFIEHFVFGDLLYRFHPIFSSLFTFWSDPIKNFYRFDSLSSDRDRQVAVLLKKSIKIIYVLNFSERNVNGSIILVVLFCGNINAKRFFMDLKFFVGHDLIDASVALSNVYCNVSILSKKFEFAGQEEDFEKLESIDQLLNFVHCLLPEGDILCNRRTSFYRMTHGNVFMDLLSLRIWFTSPLVSNRIDFVLPMNNMIVRRFCGLIAICMVSRMVYFVLDQFLSAFAILNVLNLIINILSRFLKKIFIVMEYEIRFNEKFWRYQYLSSLCLFNVQKMISFKIDELVMVFYVLVNRYEWPFFRIFSEDDASTDGCEKFEIFEQVTKMILPISEFSNWNRAGSVTKRDLARFY